jgi:DNA-binding GntR family transcriptional regulator
VSVNDVQQIVRTLEEDILLGRLMPRERLIEDALMERFAAKRYFVRQALIELERIGIVTRERHRGAAVREFSPAEVEEIYDVRVTLIRRAAELIPLPPAAALTSMLRDLQRRHSEAVDRLDIRAIWTLNDRFHETLFGACGNRYLLEEIRRFNGLSHAIRSYRLGEFLLATPRDRTLRLARDEHREMIDAIESGDRDRLVTLCVEHIMPSKNVYLARARLRERADRTAAEG